MKKILVMVDWFEPGFKAGGPIRSCVNFAKYLREDYVIYVFTGDRDLGDSHPYDNILNDRWIETADRIRVFYASPTYLSRKNIRLQVNLIDPEYIYLNSMFSRYFTLFPLLFKMLGSINAKVILAPRGMLKESALKFKPLKKKIFIGLLRALDLGKHVTFHATDDNEAKDIKANFGDKAEIAIIPNFSGYQEAFEPVKDKLPGMIKIIFVGRVHPIKNLGFLLRCLANIRANIELDVVGNIEDKEYFKECEELIRCLDNNVTVNITGDVPHSKVQKMLLANHIFCLPTQGENFSHSIIEALFAGRPVLISDQTHWKDLTQNKAGWDVSLQNPEQFRATIEKAAAMDQEQLNEWCEGAWRFGNQYIQPAELKYNYLELFN